MAVKYSISYFYGHLVSFSRFGMLHQEKSGNPVVQSKFRTTVIMRKRVKLTLALAMRAKVVHTNLTKDICTYMACFHDLCRTRLPLDSGVELGAMHVHTKFPTFKMSTNQPNMSTNQQKMSTFFTHFYIIDPAWQLPAGVRR
jgi:hypothetical protein